jgi:hypothetical protein
MITATTLTTKEACFDFQQGKEVFLFFEVPILALGSTQPPTEWAPGIMRRGSDTDHPTPSSVGVKNEWNYVSIPPYVFMVCTETKFSPNY